MASLINEGNGCRRIEFVDGDRRRRIRLGQISDRHARAILGHVEELIAAKASGHAITAETARWLSERINDEFAAKLATAGLIEPRDSAMLGDFLDNFIEKREAELKPLTLKKLRTTRDYLIEHFGAKKLLREITEGDADDWRRAIQAGKSNQRCNRKSQRRSRGDNTVRKHSQIAKQFFAAAVRKRLIRTNPFAELASTIRPNHKRYYFITRDEASKVLDACPDLQWRLLFALSRYGGLRCPSEHLLLRWADINWELGRMTVTSPKTEHHEGKESRQVPLFPELLSLLNEAWDQLGDGASEFVITRYRSTESNLRTQLHRIIVRAGLKPWPKAFQNLRSSRQTELEEQFPSHVVCAWMGNSESVAKKHYLQVTDDHFARALVSELAEVAQNAAHQMCADAAQTTTGRLAAQAKPLAMQGDALICADAHQVKVAEAGLEPARW